ncbi:MAG: response regulator, partial [Spirochaetes bacterium]|nr:response regulator [Spirochaetota bacterium]
MSEGYTTNARILIVEDEAIVAMDIHHRLEKLGYNPMRYVASGEEAVEAAAELDPDLILMDIQLAGAMDGIEAADVIRERSGTPVIFLTAYSDRTSLERAKVADAFGYVLKPFEERELGIAIEMALYKEQMQRRLSESREWLHGTVGALHEGVVTTDAAGTVLFMNRRAEELIGWSEPEAVGLSVDTVVRTEPIATAELATEILPEAVRLLRRDGSVAYVERRTGYIPEPPKRPATADGTHSPSALSRQNDSNAAVCGRVVVLREVSDILRCDHDMRAARIEAEEALKTKSEFLANVTHELRTPLNSILGMADLAHELARDEQQRDYLGILKSSAENLHGLISSILNLSRIDSGHLKLDPSEVDLDQTLESVVQSFALEARGKGLALHFAQSPKTPAYVLADRVRLVQVLSNLLANAVKYTATGSVTVSVDREDANAGAVEELVRISVSDTGPGIPESEFQRVFEPFTQVDGGPTRTFNGAGIGLAVAREIVELMGGRILLESVVGEGSVFTIELPLPSSGRSRGAVEIPP